MMQTRERPETFMERHIDPGGRTPGPAAGGPGIGGGVLVGLLALACPLLCLGPVLLAALAATGLARALHGVPWPLIAGAVLVVLALGVWGTRARRAGQAQDCCAPTRPTSRHEVPDESAR